MFFCAFWLAYRVQRVATVCRTVAHVCFCRLATLDDLVPLQQLSGLTQLGLEGNPCCNLHPISRFRIEVLARHCTSLQLMDSHKVWPYLSQMTNEPSCDGQAFAVQQSMSFWQMLHVHVHSQIEPADDGKGMCTRHDRHLRAADMSKLRHKRLLLLQAFVFWPSSTKLTVSGMLTKQHNVVFHQPVADSRHRPP